MPTGCSAHRPAPAYEIALAAGYNLPLSPTLVLPQSRDMAHFGAYNAHIWSELNLVLNFAEDVTLDDSIRHHAVKWVTCALGAIATPPWVSISSSRITQGFHLIRKLTGEDNAHGILVRISLEENTPTEWKQTFQRAMHTSWSLIGEGVSVLNHSYLYFSIGWNFALKAKCMGVKFAAMDTVRRQPPLTEDGEGLASGGSDITGGRHALLRALPLYVPHHCLAPSTLASGQTGEELNLMLKYIEDDEDVDIELRLSMLKLVIIDLEEARSPSGYAAYPPTLLIRAVNTNKIVKELFLSDDTPNEWKQMYICTMRAERILVTQGIHLFSGK
ncbi:hypothetical protein IWX48DRAFT_594770 [Phyllosticta citricarpa]